MGGGHGVPPTSGGASSRALRAQELCDLEPSEGRDQQQNSDVDTQRIPPEVGMGAKKKTMGATTRLPEPLCVCGCVWVLVEKMCHSDLAVLSSEIASEGLLWLPGVGVTFE